MRFMATVTGLTIEEFEQLPDVLAQNHELVDGELVDVSGNTGGHNKLRDVLVEVLRPFVRQHKLGLIVSEQEFQFDRNAHGPDVSFLGPAAAELFDDRLRVQLFVPDVAVEIASKNDRFESLFAKAYRYRDCGTKEVYVFSIATRQVFVCSQHPIIVLGESQTFSPHQIPGFSIRISDLFAMM
jgi:Uma2 family endonuclease